MDECPASRAQRKMDRQHARKEDIAGMVFRLPNVAIGFRPEFLDFRRGIRVANLEPQERITRIQKLAQRSLRAVHGERTI